MSKRRFPLYLQIIIGLVAGILWSFISIGFEVPITVTTHYIKPKAGMVTKFNKWTPIESPIM